MPISRKVIKALKASGAVLKRTGRHHVYEFPNGHIVSISVSPSCPFAERNQLGDIARATKQK